jgi:hypothetical protein
MAFGDDLMHLFPNATRVARADNLSRVERQQPIRIASLNAQILSHWLANALRSKEGLCNHFSVMPKSNHWINVRGFPGRE